MLKVIIGLLVIGVIFTGWRVLSEVGPVEFESRIPIYDQDGSVVKAEQDEKEDDRGEDPDTENDLKEDESEVGDSTGQPEDHSVVHLDTPRPLRSLYMTSWIAGTLDMRQNILDLVDRSEINSLVIDIKDDTGRISFPVNDPELQEIGSVERRIRDLPELIADLNDKGVYVIGRISVFQDPYLTTKRPDLAVRRASDGEVWQDRKGLTWLDPGSQEVWDYTLGIMRESYAQGFDEINLDYIRFPSDGDMSDIDYPISDLDNSTRSEILTEFFQYLDQELSDSDMIVSADLFGLVTSNPDDLKIGQILEDALPYFDYIAPMVYPSHYPPGFKNIPDPNQAPYDVVYLSLKDALERVKEAGYPSRIIRPWLQDFNYPVPYTEEMVRAQIQATYDAGLDSWMMWDPRNRYSPGAWSGLEE